MYLQKHKDTNLHYIFVKEWNDLYKEIVNWEIKLSDINDSTMIEILMTQKSEANSLFAKFI